MKKILYFLLFLGFLSGASVAQEKTMMLQAGDKAPSLVLQTAVNTIRSFGFPYKNKMVLVYFWSPSSPASAEGLYDISKISKAYARSVYKLNDGFEALTVALQNNQEVWQSDIRAHNMSKAVNCIAAKGFEDFFVKQFHMSSVPASFLVDEFGKIVLVNPDVQAICDYLDRKKNVPNAETQTRISGKILYGARDAQALKNRKIYVTNKMNDTIQTVVTNNAGSFSINNVSAESGVSLKIAKTEEIGDNDKVFLASPKGEIVSGFTKSDQGFEYRILPIDLVFLKPMKEEPEVNMVQKMPDMFHSENIFKSGGNTIKPDAAKKLDALVDKLRVYQSLNIDITARTDCKGDAGANMCLSEKRAAAVAAYFASKGIDKNRIRSEGRGETQPLNECVDGVVCDESKYAVNRRIEFRFYKK